MGCILWKKVVSRPRVLETDYWDEVASGQGRVWLNLWGCEQGLSPSKGRSLKMEQNVEQGKDSNLAQKEMLESSCERSWKPC